MNLQERIFESLSEPSGQVPAGELWTLKKRGKPYRIELLCPCGCGTVLSVFLDDQPGEREGRKFWVYTPGAPGQPGPTIRPSVRLDAGCKAHFTITNGTVEFARG